MRDRDAALGSAIHEVAAILGDHSSGCSPRIRDLAWQAAGLPCLAAIGGLGLAPGAGRERRSTVSRSYQTFTAGVRLPVHVYRA
jgi:hypothetical protein